MLFQLDGKNPRHFPRKNASWCEERMEAATWLADRGFGKPAPVRDNDAPGIGDFTIVIGDHDSRGNPLDERYKW